jgi:hypothetical protein
MASITSFETECGRQRSVDSGERRMPCAASEQPVKSRTTVKVLDTEHLHIGYE